MDRAAFLQLTVRLSRHTHSLYPQHLIIRFELFVYSFLFGKLLHDSVKHFVRFFVNICEMSGEGAAG